MVRLVFRPYTQILRSICTSEPLRASTRVSSGFTLSRYSSPSFGSQHLGSYSNLSVNFKIGRWCTTAFTEDPTYVHFHYALGFPHPNTRIHVRLLGPCFKTGRLEAFRQHPTHTPKSAWLSSVYREVVIEAITLQAATFLNYFTPT